MLLFKFINCSFLVVLIILLSITSSCSDISKNKDTLFANFTYNMTLNPDTHPRRFIIEKGAMELFVKRVLTDGCLKRIELIDSSCHNETFDKYVNLYQRKYGAMSRRIVYDTLVVNHICGAENIQWEGLNPENYEIVPATPVDDQTKYPHNDCFEVCGSDKKWLLNRKLTREEKADMIKYCGKYHIHISPKNFQSGNKDIYDEYGNIKPSRSIKIFAEPSYKVFNIITKNIIVEKKIGEKNLQLIFHSVENENSLIDMYGNSMWYIAAQDKDYWVNCRIIYSYPSKEAKEVIDKKNTQKKQKKINDETTIKNI